MRALTASMIAAAALLSVACAPRTSHQVLRPAAVSVPGHIQKIAIVDRSSPDNAGGNILGALEGAVTGEAIMADREGRERAITQLAWFLREGDRFEILQPNVRPQAIDSDVFDKPLGWKKARALCRRHGCDAIVALEAFDSDSRMFDVNGGAPVRTSDGVPVFEASRETRVLTSWRMYDTTEKAIVDELRDHSYSRTWDEEGSSLAEARSRLPRQLDTVRALGQIAGESYAQRISPTWVWVSRRYYGGGSPELKQAKRHVKAGDWDGAADIWRPLKDSPRRKVRGKAKYNLALFQERQGHLRVARKLASEAAVDLSNGRSRQYVAILDQRIREEERLKEQLAEAEAGREQKEREAQRKREERSGGRTKTIGGRSKPAGGGSKGDSKGGMSRPR